MGHAQVINSSQDASPLRVDRPSRADDALVSVAARRLLRTAESLMPDARIWNELLGSPALTSAELAALVAMARPRFVAQGDAVFTQQEPARALVFVRDGDAALGWHTADGQFRIERPVRGPGWLDQSSAWIDAAHAIDARAISPLVVVELPREDVQALLSTQPALARRLIASLAREVHSLAVSTHGLMHKDAPARFAQWLVDRCQSVPDAAAQAMVRLGERKRDIASQLAITPETLSRLMRSLTRQGLIQVVGYTVHVTDLPGLRRVADGD
jgi:CRP/FNR family transcriptional regulator, dissimilatory nitrate respiration regulator